MAVILVAALGLGFAYNATSPLAVRSTPAAVEDVSPRDRSLGTVPSWPASVPDPALRNETMSAALILHAVGAGQPSADKKLPDTLPWPAVKPLLDQGQLTLVDARDTVSFDAGHIPGAVSLPASQLQDKIGEFTARYPKTRPLVIYCSNIHCGMAHAAAVVLAEEQGYENVREMPGGYAEWVAAVSKAQANAGGK
jgi:rhodanese-related sulfurtransferase